MSVVSMSKEDNNCWSCIDNSLSLYYTDNPWPNAPVMKLQFTPEKVKILGAINFVYNIIKRVVDFRLL